MSNGRFARTLLAKPGKLDSSKSYAIYTWQAHTHSNTTQDTETGVGINWAALKRKATTSTTAKLVKKPTRSRTGTAKATVKGQCGLQPGGKVKFTLKKGTATKRTWTKALSSRTATVTLPKAKNGKWKVITKYVGNTTYAVSQDSVKYRVR